MTPPPVALPQITLERWLDDVSRPFPHDTARRIRRELEDHALTLAEARREAGHPEPEGAALAALGPAGHTQWALMQTHFTREEEDRLWSLAEYRWAEARSGWRWALNIGFGLALPYLFGLVLPVSVSSDLYWRAYTMYGIGTLLLGLLEWWIPRSFSSRSARLVLALARSFSSLLLTLCLQVFWMSNERNLWIIVTVFPAMWGIMTLFEFRSLIPLLPKALRGAR